MSNEKLPNKRKTLEMAARTREQERNYSGRLLESSRVEEKGVLCPSCVFILSSPVLSALALRLPTTTLSPDPFSELTATTILHWVLLYDETRSSGRSSGWTRVGPSHKSLESLRPLSAIPPSSSRCHNTLSLETFDGWCWKLRRRSTWVGSSHGVGVDGLPPRGSDGEDEVGRVEARLLRMEGPSPLPPDVTT